MSGADDRALSAVEREALWAEWQRLQNEPPPPDRRAIGCMTVVIAVALAAAGPPLARLAGFDMGQSMRIGAAIVLVVAFGAGIVMALLGSGKFARDSQRASASAHRCRTSSRPSARCASTTASTRSSPTPRCGCRVEARSQTLWMAPW
jgi:hypothetical protein